MIFAWVPNLAPSASGWWVYEWVAGQYLFKQFTIRIYPMVGTIHSSRFLWHLGHPLPFDLSQQKAYWEVGKNIEPLVLHFNNQPLLVFATTKRIKVLLIPKLICVIECVPPDNDHFLAFSDRLVDFLKSICCLYLSVVNKTLYSKHTVGIGLRLLPVSVPVQFLMLWTST